ncbi:MAG: nitroreductase [Rhizobiales bacterium]|nr:nitroreductase [Hyphomicrobiales bacterium]
MDALELLKTRKSISAPFLAEPAPGEAELAEMFTIASRVPDHGKLVPWRFIVFRGKARTEAGAALAALYRRHHPEADEKRLEEERQRLARAPLAVAVVSKAAPHPKIPEFEQLLSGANAAMNLELAAHALGYAAQWTTEWIAYDEEAGRILGLKAGERLIGIIHIGTSTVPPVDRPRPPLAEIVSYWTAPGEG